MLNIIKMDLLRMKKSKSTFVTLLILVMMTVFTIYIFKIESEGAFGEYTQEQMQQEDNNQNLGITMSLEESGLNAANVILAMFNSGTMLLFTGIFVVVFVMAESSTGFIKNIASSVRHRWYLIISKNIVLAVYVLVEAVLVLGISTICCKLFLPETAVGFTKAFWVALGLQYLLHVGFAFLGICLATITNSKVLGIILCICLSSGMGTMLISYVDQLLESANVKVSKYLLTSNVTSLTEQSANVVMWRILLVVFGAFVVYNVISSIVVEKRDIR